MTAEIWELRHVLFEITAVDEEEVEQAVVVVIEHGDSAAHGFGQVLGRGRRVLQGEVETRRRVGFEYGVARKQEGEGCAEQQAHLFTLEVDA